MQSLNSRSLVKLLELFNFQAQNCQCLGSLVTFGIQIKIAFRFPNAFLCACVTQIPYSGYAHAYKDIRHSHDFQKPVGHEISGSECGHV